MVRAAFSDFSLWRYSREKEICSGSTATPCARNRCTFTSNNGIPNEISLVRVNRCPFATRNSFSTVRTQKMYILLPLGTGVLLKFFVVVFFSGP